MLKSFKQGQWHFNIKNIQKNYSVLNQWENYFPWLGNILFIKGAWSPYIQKSHYKNIYQQFPNASIHIIHEANHWVHTEKYNQVVTIIEQFLLKNT